MSTNELCVHHSGFLVELYVEGLASRERRALDVTGGLRAAREGTASSYVGSVLVPADETCFHVFRSRSLRDVRAALAAAGIRGDRISRAVLIDLVDGALVHSDIAQENAR